MEDRIATLNKLTEVEGQIAHLEQISATIQHKLHKLIDERIRLVIALGGEDDQIAWRLDRDIP